MALDKLTTGKFKTGGNTIRQTPAHHSFRIIHDGEKVLQVFESGGATLTRNEIIAGKNLGEVLSEVARLKLDFQREQFDEIGQAPPNDREKRQKDIDELVAGKK